MVESDLFCEEENVEFRVKNEEAKLSVLVDDTCRLWRKAHLDYCQVSYIVKEARKRLGIVKSRSGSRVIQRLSQEELERMINHAYSKSGLYGLILKVLFFSGCRVNELVNIRVEHLNLAENEIFLSECKGGKSRNIPLFPFLKQELITHLGERRSGFLFESRLCGKFSTRRIQQIVKQVSKEVGIFRSIHPHLFRHSIATFLLNKGMPIDQVQQFLGHSKLETTQVYAKTSIQSMKDSYQKLIE